MLDINEILRAQACDNLPREVSHDNQAASTDQAVESVSGSGPAAADAAECGEGDQELGMCSDCGTPVTESTGKIHTIAGLRPYACHDSCIPF